MSDLTDRAIARITEECKEKDYLVPFEEYLTSIMTDKIAEKVLDEKKTLQGCFKAMQEIARKRQHGGCAYIPPDEGFATIREYYDIDLAEKSSSEPGVIDITDFL